MRGLAAVSFAPLRFTLATHLPGAWGGGLLNIVGDRPMGTVAAKVPSTFALAFSCMC